VNGYSIDPLRLTAIVAVSAISVMAVLRGDTQAGYTLAAAILGYVFGNSHGLVSVRQYERAQAGRTYTQTNTLRSTTPL
jgi:positive regulator of sigma E activity